MTPKAKARWRRRGYHVGYCWKCGEEFAYTRRLYLPAKRVYRAVCPTCRKRMGL